MITIHGRTKMQGYSGLADWEQIAKLRKKIKIPLIANGDIKSHEDVINCLKITHADGVMIGRGALGNPWIFNTKTQNTNIGIFKKTISRHAKLHENYYGKGSIVTFRKHLLFYINGERWPEIKNIKKIRSELCRVKDRKELQMILKQIK